MPTITDEMTIAEIMAQQPAAAAVFRQYGIEPENYKALSLESLFATAHVHQLPLAEILQALKQL